MQMGQMPLNNPHMIPLPHGMQYEILILFFKIQDECDLFLLSFFFSKFNLILSFIFVVS